MSRAKTFRICGNGHALPRRVYTHRDNALNKMRALSFTCRWRTLQLVAEPSGLVHFTIRVSPSGGCKEYRHV